MEVPQKEIFKSEKITVLLRRIRNDLVYETQSHIQIREISQYSDGKKVIFVDDFVRVIRLFLPKN